MSPKLPVVSGRKVMTALGRGGFEHVGTKGSHAKLRSSNGLRTVIVPLHKELAQGTLRSILRQGDLTPEGFELLLRRR